MKTLTTRLAAGIAAGLLVSTMASAQTLRWARSGDSLTLDPHAQNEGPTHTLAHQIYEPLLHRDMAGQITPALATGWKALDDNPNVWRFQLRKGVKFHDQSPMTAEDVVYSFKRAMKPTSAMKELLTSVKDIRMVDDHTVDIETNGPNPLLINNLTNLFIMDSGWTEKNGASNPQDVAAGETTFAAQNTNGTGAFVLISRDPGSENRAQGQPELLGRRRVSAGRQ